jgi:hypothetical protein
MRRVSALRGPLLDSGPLRVDFATRTHPDFVIADVVANPFVRAAHEVNLGRPGTGAESVQEPTSPITANAALPALARGRKRTAAKRSIALNFELRDNCCASAEQSQNG